MFCSNCGAENSDDAKFCKKCGSHLGFSNDDGTLETYEDVIEAPESTSNTKRILAICLCSIIFVIGICTLFVTTKEDCSLTIVNEEFTNENPLIIKLLDSKGNPIVNKTVEIRFFNDKSSSTFTDTTNEKGIITMTQTFSLGRYNITCTFNGDDKYNSVSNTKLITIKKSEPDYESYDYPCTFGETDTDGDGYVMLSDMNIAHTPEETQMQMFADSDDDNDGKLNKHEYYKFMYKLNYDYHSYGL